jgi:hypothetical protein
METINAISNGIIIVFGFILLYVLYKKDNKK